MSGGFHSDWALVRKLGVYLKAHKGLFLLALSLYPLSALSVVIPPYLIQQILDEVIPAKDLDLLTMLASLYLCAIVFDYIAGFASQFFMSVLGQKAMKDLRNDLYRHVQKLPAAYYDKNPLGRILTRLTNDVESLAEVFATGAVTIIADLITIVAIVSAMLWMDVKMAMLAFAVLPVLVIVTIFSQRYARTAFRGVRKHLARINAFLSEHLAGMFIVQSFGQEKRTYREFLDLNIAYRDANQGAILVDASLFAVV